MSTAPTTPFSGRYLTLEEMVTERQRLKAAGKRLVFTNGCFDILHLGHATYLAWARAQGDALVVAINTDASVRRNKGPKRPIVGQDDRAALLLALRCVDYVVIFDDDTPLGLISALLPDVLVKGSDWAGRVVGANVVEALGGCGRLAELVPGHSTTGVIERALDVYGARS